MYVLAYDVGTTGVKTCLIKVEKEVRFVCGEYAPYSLKVLKNGGVEQNCDEWWLAVKATTKSVLDQTNIDSSEIEGITFCSQMQGLILVDKDCNALRPPMSYLDQRATTQMTQMQNYGLTISGVNVFRLLKSLFITNAASTSVKDPIWKYKWVQEKEPEIYEKIYKWLDVKEYFIAKLTGRCVMTPDSAYATFLYDPRKGRKCWSKSLCNMYGVKYEHLPDIVACTDIVGGLKKEVAEELGLKEGTAVYGGGGDATLIGVGAGATVLGDTHIYWGTSGWVGTVIDSQKVDIFSMIAGIVGAEKGKYNYFAEMETAGKCFEWVKDHIVLDEIDAYFDKVEISQLTESEFQNIYTYMSNVISDVRPGSNGVIFTPWLHGNRCPFEDPSSAGMFFNIKIDTQKKHLLRAVVEGVCYHLRWMLEASENKVKTSKEIRFVGGGALSDVICQVLADVTRRKIVTVENCKDAGAVGAAMLVAVGRGQIDNLSEAKNLIEVTKEYYPNPAVREIYDKNFAIFKKLYASNKKYFKELNRH